VSGPEITASSAVRGQTQVSHCPDRESEAAKPSEVRTAVELQSGAFSLAVKRTGPAAMRLLCGRQLKTPWARFSRH